MLNEKELKPYGLDNPSISYMKDKLHSKIWWFSRRYDMPAHLEA
jgi:hypothetical protein